MEIVEEYSVSLNDEDLPSHPAISKDDENFYIFAVDKIFVLDKEFNIEKKIIIDYEKDLLIESRLLEWHRLYKYGFTITDDKIIVYISLMRINEYGSFYSTSGAEIFGFLEMDKDGTNKRLIVFDKINEESSTTTGNITTVRRDKNVFRGITYNKANKKVVIFASTNFKEVERFEYNSNGKKVKVRNRESANENYNFEYKYDKKRDNYILSDSYKNDKLFNDYEYKYGVFTRFNGNTGWRTTEMYTEGKDGEPMEWYDLIKFVYYRNSKFYTDAVILHCIHFELSDFLIDEKYLWLLSKKRDDGKYKLIKIRPL